MRSTRIYVDLELTGHQELLLPAAQSTHVLRVLRLRPGAALTLFNGRGGEYAAELIDAGKSGARLAVRAHSVLERESPLQLTLLQGVARGERMDAIVQKATELGVQRIVPLSCEFSVVRLDAANRQRRAEHWRAVAIAACEQSGRNRIPEIEPIGDFAESCAASSAGLRLMLLPQAPESLAALAAGLQSAVLLVGPEGGLSGREQLQAQRCGFRPCRLGPRILRTETAPLAALAALQALAGDLR
ncbi:MAG TPA: 16S rRNA (uracil(1498)-N(3))-methyltransferase [Steroidobacteraceae bacterium]|nr:16S rRNA (uracil(1498)-N(3))-methyltransferase [Steroidobacteraceae bacterium]